MRDLTHRALDTASAQGAGYADVRVIRRLEESISIKSGRVEGVASGESEGFGVRVLVDGAWGFAGIARPDRVGSGSGRRRSGPDRPRQRDRAARTRPSSTTARPPTARYETPFEEDPFAVPLETKIGDLLAADQAAAGVKGIAFTEIDVCGPARVEDLRRHRREPDRAGHHPRRRRHRGPRRRRRRAPAPELPGFGWRLGRRWLRDRPRASGSPNGPVRWPRKPSSCSPRRSVRRVGSRSSSTRRSCTSRSTSRAATRPSSIACSGPRRPTRERAS